MKKMRVGQSSYLVFGRPPGKRRRREVVESFPPGKWQTAVKFAARLLRKDYSGVEVVELTTTHVVAFGE